MEETEGKKRAREESDLDFLKEERVEPEAKRLRNDSVMNSGESGRVDSDELVTLIPNEILDFLDEPDSVADCDPASQDLDSFIKSFEEEILQPSLYGESPPDLGYLLEASDDELGLPPTVSSSDEPTEKEAEAVAPEVGGLSEILGFENELPSYDSFGLGIGEETQLNEGGEFVTVGGLFDHESADFLEFLYQPESLHAR